MGCVERHNRTLKDTISALILAKPEVPSWVTHLWSVQKSVNNMPHAAHGGTMTAAQVLFGALEPAVLLPDPEELLPLMGLNSADGLAELWDMGLGSPAATAAAGDPNLGRSRGGGARSKRTAAAAELAELSDEEAELPDDAQLSDEEEALEAAATMAAMPARRSSRRAAAVGVEAAVAAEHGNDAQLGEAAPTRALPARAAAASSPAGKRRRLTAVLAAAEQAQAEAEQAQAAGPSTTVVPEAAGPSTAGQRSIVAAAIELAGQLPHLKAVREKATQQHEKNRARISRTRKGKGKQPVQPFTVGEDIVMQPARKGKEEAVTAQQAAAESEARQGQQQRAAEQHQDQQQLAPDPPVIVSSLTDWEQRPESTFQAPVSRCMISPDGSVTQGPPPGPSKLPFLFNVTPQAVPSKQEACRHCPGDEHKCDGPRLPHSCCGVCQFDGRLCSKLYAGEGRSEALVELVRSLGLQLEDFSPCELFQRIRGRTLWLMGDSQTWQFYYAVECFLREFAPSLRRSDPVPPDHMDKLSSAQQGYCKRWWPVPPECLELAQGTRVCIVRVDLAGEMADVALPTLMEHVPGFERDLLVYNSGLHYFEFDGPSVCSNTTCAAPGPGSRYLRELEQLAAFREAHAGQLPASVWMDTSPQHFPRTGYYVGEFHAEQCLPWQAWEEGEPLARRGGMWNVAAAPFVPRLADAHLRTWEPSVHFWATHMPAECTHWCHPSAYHVWLAMLNRLLAETPGLAADVAVQPAAAATRAVAGQAAATAAHSSRRAARRERR
ncbi:hypothetical protein ABPG75_009234 [Micractinium tetrahymenae]